MKIIEDKVTVYPPHAIGRGDVQVIVSALPPEWAADLGAVRLSAASSHPNLASFSRFSGTLTIRSRGCAREETLRAIFVEMAVHGLGLKFARFRRLQARDASRVDRLVAPLVEGTLPLLSRKKVWLDR